MARCYLPLPALATHSGRTCCQPAAAAEKGPAHKQFWFGAQSSSGRKPGLQQHVWEVGGLMREHLWAVLKALGEFAPGEVGAALRMKR